MKVLIVGGGGREHALAWKLSKDPQITQLYAAPGNPGIAKLAECVPISPEATDELLTFAREQQIDWTVVGPEAPLCAGLVDRFREADLKVFGPVTAAARLEGSKIFSKLFMQEHGIPTAPFGAFESADEVRQYITEQGLPQVIKADGLAAGKGVFVCHSIHDVEDAIDKIFVQQTFGDAGKQVLVEACLEGVEASFLVFSDGDTALPLAPAQDHKPVFDDNQGPNTGGMGTFCPTDTLPPNMQSQILETIVQPVLDGMKAQGTPFQGILYTGLILTSEGPQVLEFNVRFGDPEAQVILPRLQTELVDIFEASQSGQLKELQLAWDARHAVCVVMASEGYPGSYRKEDEILGLDQIHDPDVIVFHAGTKQQNGKVVTNGGRVLGVTGLGDNRSQARAKAYAAVDKITWPGVHYRKDIGQ